MGFGWKHTLPHSLRYAMVYIMNADGSGKHRVTPYPSCASWHSPTWSPDGLKLAAHDQCASAECGYIEVIDAESAALTRAADYEGSAASISWSSDGRRILFAGATVEKRGEGGGSSPTWVGGYRIRLTDPLAQLPHEAGEADEAEIRPLAMGDFSPAWQP